MLIVTAVAVTAISGAAVAQAEGPNWYLEGEKLETAIAVEAAGELQFQGPFLMGPCEVLLEGVLENKSGHAAGDFFAGEVPTHPCGTALPGCTLEVDLYNFSWNISADATGVSIDNTRFTNKWSPYCRTMYGFSETWTWGGTLKTPTFTEGCLEYEGAGSLAMIPTGPTMKTTGALCLSTPEGENITLK
jgi:hypothetical protein